MSPNQRDGPGSFARRVPGSMFVAGAGPTSGRETPAGWQCRRVGRNPPCSHESLGIPAEWLESDGREQTHHTDREQSTICPQLAAINTPDPSHSSPSSRQVARIELQRSRALLPTRLWQVIPGSAYDSGQPHRGRRCGR